MCKKKEKIVHMDGRLRTNNFEHRETKDDVARDVEGGGVG